MASSPYSDFMADNNSSTWDGEPVNDRGVSMSLMMSGMINAGRTTETLGNITEPDRYLKIDGDFYDRSILVLYPCGVGSKHFYIVYIYVLRAVV